MMSHSLGKLRSLGLLSLGLAVKSVLISAPVINEIMYRPDTTYPENTKLEFIEIHNPDTTATDLSSWSISTGAKYTFPSGTSIPAGGFLIVAADPATLQTATGLSGVLGPWATGATLLDKGGLLMVEA